jgi:hypothetical protein
MVAAWNSLGTPLLPHPRCMAPVGDEVCNADEIGSSCDAAWCHACGWRGSLTDLRARAEARTTTPPAGADETDKGG